MTIPVFMFGDKVRRIGSNEVFVVLGLEPNIRSTKTYQIARINIRTAAKAIELELA